MATSNGSNTGIWARLVKVIYLEHAKNPMPILNPWLRSFDLLEQEFIKDKLYPILSLPKVHVPHNVIRALTYHWNPEEVTFTLGSYVLSPTIEEYSRLLMTPPMSEGIYVPNLARGAVNIISKYFGIKCKEVSSNLEECNEQCIKLSALMQWFADLEAYKKNRDIFCGTIEDFQQNRVNAFLVAAFGTILFHNGDSYIHFRIVELVDQHL